MTRRRRSPITESARSPKSILLNLNCKCLSSSYLFPYEIFHWLSLAWRSVAPLTTHSHSCTSYFSYTSSGAPHLCAPVHVRQYKCRSQTNYCHLSSWIASQRALIRVPLDLNEPPFITCLLKVESSCPSHSEALELSLNSDSTYSRSFPVNFENSWTEYEGYSSAQWTRFSFFVFDLGLKKLQPGQTQCFCPSSSP